MAKVTCPYCSRVFPLGEIPIKQLLLPPHGELDLARAAGCYLITMEKGKTTWEIMSALDKIGAIQQIGFQSPDNPTGSHAGPDLCEGVWVKQRFLADAKAIIKGKNARLWEWREV